MSAAKATLTPSSRPAPPTVEEATSLYEFDHAFPAQAARLPGLRALLEQERAELRARLITEAIRAQTEAAAAGHDYQPYALGKAWLKVTETPRFLSLSATLYSSTGGAHPNHGFESLVWDKASNARLSPLDLFIASALFDRALRSRFCAALDLQRSERRAAPVEPESGSPFDQCIAPSEQTVILGSSNGRRFDRIGVLIAPYAAGPYAEGDYEITLPVDRALLDTVKPTFRGVFAAR